MLSSVVLIAAVCASLTDAAPAPAKGYQCTKFSIPIPVNNVTTIISPLPAITSQLEATYFANLLTERGAPAPQAKTAHLTKTFNISGSVCKPTTSNANTSTLQILSHGLGFNSSYWDFYLPSKPNDTQYSYVHAATELGYTTLSYDRLGIAPSAIANPVTEIQTLVELSILASLTTLARSGRIPSLKTQPKKVVHVGHSYGSQLTNALSAVAPTLSDGIILTGYSHITTYNSLFLASTQLHIMNQNQPKRFPKKTYPNAFLTWSDASANQYSFLSYPHFDPAVLTYAEATKQPFTLGEFISSAALPLEAPNFTAPVLYLEGQNDLIFCGFNCTTELLAGTPNEKGPAVAAFNGSSSVEVYIQPNTGHGINLHYNTTGSYGVMLDWVARNVM